MSQFIEMFGDPLSPIQKWPIVRLGDYCIVNPTKPKGISDEMEVSFIPMQDVSDDGSCNKFINRPYAEVKKGFTYCADGDVIFAKITPCMENGKGAELQGLTNAIGMGSTEFHVLRPISGKSISTWLYHFTKLDIIRKDAAKNMTGTGGQKRVPASYFDNFKIGVPSIDEQMNFAALANQADKSKFGDFKSQFIEMLFKKPITGKIGDLVDKKIFSVKKIHSMNDIIEYIDISSVERSNHSIVETTSYVVSNAPSRAQQCVRLDDILVSTVRPINRNIAVVNSDKNNLVASTGFCVLRPKLAFKEYLLAIVQSDKYTEAMIDKASGGLYPAVNNGDVLNYGIYIPDEEFAKKFSLIYQQADKSKSYVRIALKNLESILGYCIRQVA